MLRTARARSWSFTSDEAIDRARKNLHAATIASAAGIQQRLVTQMRTPLANISDIGYIPYMLLTGALIDAS